MTREVILERIKVKFKPFFPVFAVAVIYIVFHRLIDQIWDTVIVSSVLSSVSSHWLIDLVFLFAAIGFTVFVLLHINQFVVSKTNLYLLVFVVLVYSYHRWGQIRWEFESFDLIPALKYFDGLYFLLLGNCFLLFKWEPRKTADKKAETFEANTLFTDEAAQEDFLGYQSYAKHISNTISNKTFDRTFAIGITGEWGAGKTSFINFVKKEINLDSSEDIISFDFNPWKYSSASIVTGFFDDLRSAVRPYHHSVSRLIRSYAQKINKRLIQKLWGSCLPE